MFYSKNKNKTKQNKNKNKQTKMCIQEFERNPFKMWWLVRWKYFINFVIFSILEIQIQVLGVPVLTKIIFPKDTNKFPKTLFWLFLKKVEFSILSHHILRAPISFLIACISALKSCLAEEKFSSMNFNCYFI